MINRSTVYSESYVYCSLIKKLFSLIVIFWIAEVYEPPKIKKKNVNKCRTWDLEWRRQWTYIDHVAYILLCLWQCL